MNLSSPFQMPSTPSVASTPSKPSTPGAVAGAGLDAGASFGLDFANIMARQYLHLPTLQRQAFAAPETPNEATAQTESNSASPSQAAPSESSSASANDPLQGQPSPNTPDPSADTPPERRVSSANDASEANTHSQYKTRQRSTNASPSDNTVLDAAWLVPAAVVSPAAQAVASDAAVAPSAGTSPWLAQAGWMTANATPSNASGKPAALQTIALSPKMRIITDPSQAPNPESLTAFAKSMGLDESTIQQLMGQPSTSSPATPALSVSVADLTAASATAVSNRPMALSTHALSGVNLPNAADVGNALPSAPQVAVTVSAATVLNTPLNLPQAPSNTAMPVAAASLATDASALQSLDIAAVSVMGQPSAATPTTTSTPSTASVLSLLGAGLNEQDIAKLSASFSGSSAGDNGENGQSNANSSSGNAGNGAFSQTLAQANGAASSSKTATAAAAASSTSMSEVYDQLSDKLANEMAARMHKQLSDGQWKMKFGLRPSNLGGVEIQLEMKDGKLDAVFHADNPLTRDLLQNGSQRLRDALENFGIQAGQVQIGQERGQSQQNPSHGAANRRQVEDNSTSQVNHSDNTAGVDNPTPKGSASSLDLYA